MVVRKRFVSQYNYLLAILTQEYFDTYLITLYLPIPQGDLFTVDEKGLYHGLQTRTIMTGVPALLTDTGDSPYREPVNEANPWVSLKK
jgi:hypothetical protein